MPRAPEGWRLYAVGDIHGRHDLLRRLHGMIVEDAASAPGPRNRIVYLGDYIDRGPDSRAVVETLTHPPPQGFEAVHLKGNHEDFLLRFLEDGSDWESWMLNGGAETLLSYGVDPFGAAVGEDAVAIDDLRRNFLSALPSAHVEFFRALETVHVAGGYCFVHAGVRPGVQLERQTESDLLWIRRAFLDSRTDFGKVVVHGHSISTEPEVLSNRIGIDTGAYLSGRLTCLVLEGATQRFFHT